MVFVPISLFEPIRSVRSACLFFFFPPDSKVFSYPTFLVHISMEYLIITSQNLKSGFAPRQSSLRKGSNWVLVNSQRVAGGNYSFLSNLFFLFYFHEQVQGGVTSTRVVEIHKLLPPMLIPSQKFSGMPESGVHNVLLPSQARKSSCVISLLKSYCRNLCTTLPHTLQMFSEFFWVNGKRERCYIPNKKQKHCPWIAGN